MRKMQEARTGRAKLNLPPLADGCVRLRYTSPLSLRYLPPLLASAIYLPLSLRYLPPPLASAIFHPP